MRAAVAAALALAGLLAPVATSPCHVEVVVDAGSGPVVEAAVGTVARALTVRGVETEVSVATRVRARDRVFDWDRVLPDLWPASTRTVTVFTGPATRERELGRAVAGADEIVLVDDLVDADLFPASAWEATVAHELGHLAGLVHEDGGVMVTGQAPDDIRLTPSGLDQLAAAVCG